MKCSEGIFSGNTKSYLSFLQNKTLRMNINASWDAKRYTMIAFVVSLMLFILLLLLLLEIIQ